MNYKKFKDIENNYHIAIINDDGSRTTFSANIDNLEYKMFLESNGIEDISEVTEE